MRIALFSDIHGNLAALEAVTDDARSRGVDQIINLGDSLSGPLLPRETAQFLMAEGWLSLAGNHERQILDPAARGPLDEFALSTLGSPEIAWLQSQKHVHRLDEEVLLCHGTPDSDLIYLLETFDESGFRPATREEVDQRLESHTAPLIACGHSHIPRSVRTTRGQLVVNPGSVGLPAARATEPVTYKVENRSPDARYAIIEKTKAGWTASLISVPYDHRSMAALAARRGRHNWEVALLTGYAS